MDVGIHNIPMDIKRNAMTLFSPSYQTKIDKIVKIQ